MPQSTIVIADDDPHFRAVLKDAIGRHRPDAQVVEVSSLDTLQRAIAEHANVALILLDLRIPGARGFSLLLYLKAEHPTIPVILVSVSDGPGIVQRALDFGASGFIPKSARATAIGGVLRTVLGGGVAALRAPNGHARIDLEDREAARRLASLSIKKLKVLVQLADGHSNKYIAGHLAITEATVKAHITGILRTLGIERRTQAAILAQRLLQTGKHAEGNSLDDEG